MKSTDSGSSSRKDAVNSSGLAARLATRKQQQKRFGITWQDANDALLTQAISLVVESGSLISFSRTSDGGALVMTVLDDGARTPYYFTQSDELEEVLKWIVDELFNE